MGQFSAAYTKQQFIDMINKEVGDDEVIIMSSYNNGLQYNNTKKKHGITFDMFVPMDGLSIRALEIGERAVYRGMMIGNKDILNETFRKQVFDK